MDCLNLEVNLESHLNNDISFLLVRSWNFGDSKQLHLRFVFEIWRFRNNNFFCWHEILNVEN